MRFLWVEMIFVEIIVRKELFIVMWVLVIMKGMVEGRIMVVRIFYCLVFSEVVVCRCSGFIVCMLVMVLSVMMNIVV